MITITTNTTIATTFPNDICIKSITIYIHIMMSTAVTTTTIILNDIKNKDPLYSLNKLLMQVLLASGNLTGAEIELGSSGS